MENGKKGSVNSLIVEFLVAVALIIGIIFTLNYFNVVPLSNEFSFLSFLPHQAITNPITEPSQTTINQEMGTSVVGVVRSIQPLTADNSGNGSYLYQLIPGGSLTLSKSTRIDVELSTTVSSGSGGIIFANKNKYTDLAYKAIHVFLNQPKNNWLLEYRSQSKSNYLFLVKGGGDNFKKFTLIIPSDGKSITVLSPAFEAKTLKLQDPVFSGENKLDALIEVAPKSKTVIYSLYYQH